MNNKGFSLIEIIVTIAILAIAGGSLIWTTRYVDSGNTRKCTEKIDSLLGMSRIETMSKSDDYTLVIYEEAGKYYARITSAPSTDTTKGTELGNKRINIFYRVEGEATDRQVSVTDKLEINFDKSSGAFLPLASGSYITSIIIKTSSGGGARTIFLVSTTGKHYVK